MFINKRSISSLQSNENREYISIKNKYLLCNYFLVICLAIIISLRCIIQTTQVDEGLMKIVSKLIVVLFFFSTISQCPEKVPPKPVTSNDFDQILLRWTKSFAEVAHIIHSKYHEIVNPEKAMINAINAFVSTLDPHSTFMDPQSYKQIMEATAGRFPGIGVLVNYMREKDQEFLEIIDTIPAGPADKAGVRAGDLIVQINNDGSLKGQTVDEIVAQLKGKRNTPVTIKVKRGNNPELLSFTIMRDIVIEQDALCYYFKDNNIYYLSLRLFTENSINQLEQLLKKCLSQHSKGLILDLRNNSGGLLNAVIDIAGLFLPKDSLVVITQERDKRIEYKTTRAPIDNIDIPIFIIVNNLTASAAEILAGCLKIHSDEKQKSDQKTKIPPVFLVGSKTFGKGSVQEVIPIPNDCAAKVTTALYYLPNNTSIQSVGIQPDFSIEQRFSPTKEMEWFNKLFGHESSLKNAIKNKNTESAETKAKDEKEETLSWGEKKQKQTGSDYIILSTLRLLEMFSMAKKAFPELVSNRQDSINFLKKNYVADDAIAMEEITI